jgi:hypothetical protein
MSRACWLFDEARALPSQRDNMSVEQEADARRATAALMVAAGKKLFECVRRPCGACTGCVRCPRSRVSASRSLHCDVLSVVLAAVMMDIVVVGGHGVIMVVVWGCCSRPVVAAALLFMHWFYCLQSFKRHDRFVSSLHCRGGCRGDLPL